MHRWFDRFLYKIDNGIERTPQLSVERAPDQWVDYDSFPAAGTATSALYPTPGNDSSGGGLQSAPPTNASVTVAANDGTTFATSPLSSATRLSGDVSVHATVRSSVKGNATVVVVVHDLGSTTTRGYSGSPDSNPVDTGIRDPQTSKSCWGESIPGDSACFWDTPPDIVTTDSIDLSFGARDLRHADSITAVQPVPAGGTYSMTIPTWTMDRILPAGHRLGLEIDVYGPSRAVYSIDLASTSISLPVVGGVVPFAAPASTNSAQRLRLTPAGPTLWPRTHHRLT